jgi:hypothetical protein
MVMVLLLHLFRQNYVFHPRIASPETRLLGRSRVSDPLTHNPNDRASEFIRGDEQD